MASQNHQRLLKSARSWANWSDSAFSLFGIRFGWDFIIGLIPGLGDVISVLISMRLLIVARALGAPLRLQLRILVNLLLDFFVGLVPIIGDVLDVFFRANQMNLLLLEKWYNTNRIAQSKM